MRIEGLHVRAELARTPDERALGLGGRDVLSPGASVLFLFPTDTRPVFWMKDMRFALDFVWISADGRVVDVTEDVPAPTPGTTDSALPQYLPRAPVRYVLEVNAGLAAQGGVRTGDAVAFDPAPPTGGVR